jgi:ATP-dependent DNA ligase
MPPFVEPQFPKLADGAPVGPQWIHEVNFEGYPMQLRVEKKAVTVTAAAMTGPTSFLGE